MALIRCPECKAKISDKAGSCPSCGAPVLAAAPRNEPSATSRKSLGIGCLVLFVLLVFAGIVSGGNQAGNTVAANSALTEGNTSAEDKAATARTEFAALAVASLRKALRDPDSFKLERAFTTMDAKYACVLYRARNGFGGMNRERVVFTTKGGDQSASAWNRRCVKGEFSEQTAAAGQLGEVIDSATQ